MGNTAAAENDRICRTVKRSICVAFDELTKYKTWWLLIDNDSVDLCTEDPGKDIDLYINSDVRTMVEVWAGDRDLRKALRDE